MKRIKEELPNPGSPGSDEAIELGCTCPVIDNGHGRGAYRDKQGQMMFWIALDCKLHAKEMKPVAKKPKKDKKDSKRTAGY